MNLISTNNQGNLPYGHVKFQLQTWKFIQYDRIETRVSMIHYLKSCMSIYMHGARYIILSRRFLLNYFWLIRPASSKTKRNNLNIIVFLNNFKNNRRVMPAPPRTWFVQYRWRVLSQYFLRFFLSYITFNFDQTCNLEPGNPNNSASLRFWMLIIHSLKELYAWRIAHCSRVIFTSRS